MKVCLLYYYLFTEFLKNQVARLTDEDVEASLTDVLSQHERVGLAMRIKAAISSKLEGRTGLQR